MRNEDEIHFMDQRVVFDRRRMQQRARAGTSNTDTNANTDANTETELERLRRQNYHLRMERDALRALKALREGKLDDGWN